VLAAQLVGNAGYFAGVLLLARALHPAGRGTVAFITVTALVTAHLCTLGIPDASRVFAAQRPADQPVLLTNLMLATVVVGLAGAVAVAGVLLVLPGIRPAGVGTVELALLVGGTVATGLAGAGYAFFQGAGRFSEYTRVTALGPWLYAAALAGIWVAFGLTVARAALAWVVAQALAPAAILLVQARRSIGFGRPSRALMREAVGFGVRAWGGGLAYFLNARADQIIMGIISTEATLGIYAVAVNASEILFYVPAAAAAALLPAVARQRSGDGADPTLRVFRLLALTTLGTVLVAALLGPLLLPLLFGPRYQPSVVPFLLLLPSALGYAAMINFSNSLVASSAPGLSSLGPLVALSLQSALDFALIPPLGARGAGIAASVALLSGGAVAAIVYRRRTPFDWGALLPRGADVRRLQATARRLLRRTAPLA
jgi:O-antigen/teichoic acid export membrane protein